MKNKIKSFKLFIESESCIPTNNMGTSSSDSGPINTIDPLLFKNKSNNMKKKINDLIKNKKKKD